MILDSNFSKKKLRGEIREGLKKMTKYGTSTGQDRTALLHGSSCSKAFQYRGDILYLGRVLCCTSPFSSDPDKELLNALQCCASSKTALVVFLVPLPQVTLQALQGSQSPTLQSTSYRIRRRSFFQYEGDSICIYTLTLLGVAPLCDL